MPPRFFIRILGNGLIAQRIMDNEHRMSDRALEVIFARFKIDV